MKNSKPIITILLLLLCTAINSYAQDKQQPFSKGTGLLPADSIETVGGKRIAISQLDKFICQAIDSAEMPGLSIAIINDAEVVYHRTFGVSNVETGKVVSGSTIFEGASLSKPIFAYFVMQMVERGVLDLDTPLHQYLPHPGIDSASLEYYRMVTPRMVLAHSAGFPNWSHDEPISIAFKPGTGFSYSGEAYQYLAATLGTLLGVGWEAGLDTVFQKEVATPLGMQHSSFTPQESLTKFKATGHEEGKVTDAVKTGKVFGAGYSLHTEARDYAEFLIEMMKGEHLSREMIEEMLKEQTKFPSGHELLASGQTGWGLGFARRPTPHGVRYMHTGNNHDFMAFCSFYKEKQHGLVLFTNSDKIEPFYRQLGKFLEDEF